MVFTIIRFAAVCISLFSVQLTIGQNNYEFPSNYEYAGVALNIDEKARKIIQNDINNLTVNKNFLKIKFEKMSLFMPIVEDILLKNNLPNDFKYLIVQESGINPDVVSSSNAVGFWQFKKESGETFGLRIDNEIDERKNIQASTKAACKYLKNSQLTLKNWVSSLLSYRLGLGGATKNVDNDWKNNSNIDIKASVDWYILRSLAYKFVFSQPLDDFYASGNKLIEYRNGSGKTIKEIALETKMNESDIKKLNSWLISETTPNDKEYVFTLLKKNEEDSPIQLEDEKIDENALFVNKKEKKESKTRIENSKIKKKKTRIIEIKPEKGSTKNKKITLPSQSDTQSEEIALLKTYDEKNAQLKKNDENNLFLPTGLHLDYDKKTTNLTSPFAKRLSPKNSKKNAIFYEISGLLGILAQKNESVKSLARKSGITINELIHYNELSNENDIIVENQIYFLEKKGKKHHAKKHISTSGQTFWEIAQWYGVAEKELVKYNKHINSGSEIPLGSKIYLQKHL